MKNKNVLVLLFLIALTFVMPKNLKSQIIEVGATGGISYYVGDLNPNKHFSNIRPSFGGVVRYYNNLRWTYRFQYSCYNIKIQPTDEIVSQKPEYKDKQYDFPVKINDFAFLTEFNFLNYWTGSNRDYVTSYIFVGLSGFNQRINGKAGNEADGKYAVSIPFGFGVKYSLFRRLGMTLEWRMHKTLADDIDNVTDKSDSFNFGYDRDWISALEMSIVYRFNLPRKCNCNGIRIR